MVSADTTSGPPAKRRKCAEPRTLLKDLPADEFQKKASLYNGPMVTITVHEKEFPLSKPLLCHYTSFFEGDLNSPIKEGEARKLVFNECSPETFQLVFQWIYFSQINVPSHRQTVHNGPINCSQNSGNGSADVKVEVKASTPEVQSGTPFSSGHISAVPTAVDAAFTQWMAEEGIEIRSFQGIATNEKAQSISRILAFLKLAHKIDLLGPFDSVVAEIRALLQASRSALLPGHIRLAAVFPSKHPVRDLIVEACVKDFALDTFPRIPSAKATQFRFSKELDELDGFAADLIRAYRKAPKKKTVPGKKDGPSECQCLDPLTSTWFRMPAN